MMTRLLPVPALAIAALLSSCSTTPDPEPSRTFKPGYVRQDVSPTAAAVERTTTDVRREADALRGQVGILRRTAAEATAAATTAGDELARLVEAKSATEGDLLNLQSLFTGLQRRNLFLEQEAETLAKSHENLKETIATMETTVSELRVAAARADEGKAELLALLAAANDHNDALTEANRKLAKTAQAAEKTAASAKTWRNIVLIAIGVAVLLAVVWIVVRTYKPPWSR